MRYLWKTPPTFPADDYHQHYPPIDDHFERLMENATKAANLLRLANYLYTPEQEAYLEAAWAKQRVGVSHPPHVGCAYPGKGKQ